MCNMLGLGDMNADQLASKLEETLPVIRSVSEQFKDPVSDPKHMHTCAPPLWRLPSVEPAACDRDGHMKHTEERRPLSPWGSAELAFSLRCL